MTAPATSRRMETGPAWDRAGNPELQLLGLCLLDGSLALEAVRCVEAIHFAERGLARALQVIASLARPGRAADLAEVAAAMVRLGLAYDESGAAYVLARAADETEKIEAQALERLLIEVRALAGTAPVCGR